MSIQFILVFPPHPLPAMMPSRTRRTDSYRSRQPGMFPRAVSAPAIAAP